MIPSAAIFVPHPAPGHWLIAETPVTCWSRPDAATLVREVLGAAEQALTSYSNGLVVGLLPYPGNALGAGHTQAHLFLYEYAKECADLPGSFPGNFRLTSPFRPATSATAYVAAVRKIQAYLAAGDAYQVNLAQRFFGEYEGDPWAAFVSVANRFAAPHAAWLRMPDRDLLSFSPESFLDRIGNRVVTRPIKGTRPRGATEQDDLRLAQDLREHPKDRAENLMIVDLLRNDIGRACLPGSISVPELFKVESFRNVHHLVSTVSGTMAPEKSLADLLTACFPGGSITGAPKVRAMEIIAELEETDRDVYCGTVFWLKPDGRFGSNILIRTFLAKSGVIEGWAGAGIVSDSSPEGEYQECLDKIMPLIRAFTP